MFFIRKSGTEEVRPTAIQSMTPVIDIKTALPISQSQIDSNQVQTVNARNVHAFLGVETPFTMWIQRRIQEYNFSEETDFVTFLLESSGGRPSTDYALTLSMAKELCMVERNDKGKQARQYFLECERQVLTQVAVQSPKKIELFLSDVKQMLAEAEKVPVLSAQNKQLTLIAEKVVTENTKLKPKAEAFDRLLSTQGSFCITDVAKQLNTSCKLLTVFLTDPKSKLCYRRFDKFGDNSKMPVVPYQNRVDSGHLIEKPIYSERGKYVNVQTRITSKGLIYIEDRFKKWANKHGISIAKNPYSEFED